MTSSTFKIVLLLGLIVVVIIMFIISSPPSSPSQIVPPQTELPNIGTGDHKAISHMEKETKPVNTSPTRIHTIQEGETLSVKKEDKPTNTPPTRIYTIQEGDTLSGIAIKFYGEDEGSKEININRIFEANRKKLKSADVIYIDQRIVIPPLPNSATGKDNIRSLLPGAEFEEVQSIGRRHF